jgi:hypothetical protein
VTKEVINKQLYLLFSAETIIRSPTAKHNELILTIMDLIVKHSKSIREAFGKDVEEWIEMFGFSERLEQF